MQSIIAEVYCSIVSHRCREASSASLKGLGPLIMCQKMAAPCGKGDRNMLWKYLHFPSLLNIISSSAGQLQRAGRGSNSGFLWTLSGISTAIATGFPHGHGCYDAWSLQWAGTIFPALTLGKKARELIKNVVFKHRITWEKTVPLLCRHGITC